MAGLLGFRWKGKLTGCVQCNDTTTSNATTDARFGVFLTPYINENYVQFHL